MLTRTSRAGWATPFDALLDVHRELDRVFDGEATNGRDAWRPLATDVVETPDEVRVTIEVPGLSVDDIDITIDNNMLRISGEKQSTHKEGDGTAFRLTERRYGRFERSFVLPQDVNAEECTADYENGVLTVAMAKREEAKPRKVRIAGASAGREIGTGEDRSAK